MYRVLTHLQMQWNMFHLNRRTGRGVKVSLINISKWKNIHYSPLLISEPLDSVYIM